MKFKSLVAVLVVSGLLLTSLIGAEEAKDAKKDDIKEILKTVKCPLSGKAVDETKTVVYKDSKVYFCCENCPKAFAEAAKTKPEVAAKANQQLVMTKQATQVLCVMNGKGKINKETKLKVAGLEVNTCCKNCLGKLTEMAEKDQMELVFGKNFDKAFEVKAQKEKENKEKEKKAA